MHAAERRTHTRVDNSAVINGDSAMISSPCSADVVCSAAKKSEIEPEYADKAKYAECDDIAQGKSRLRFANMLWCVLIAQDIEFAYAGER